MGPYVHTEDEGYKSLQEAIEAEKLDRQSSGINSEKL